MITSYLMGGLGNQLFQIFTTICYSLNNNIPFFLSYHKMSREDRQTVYWENFLIKLKKFTTTKNINLPTYREKEFTYMPLPTKNIPNHFQLFGYFQNEKYFLDQYDKIINLIELRKQQKKVKVPEKSISMHFRIGDYILPKFKDAHPLMPINYYRNALKHIIKKTHKENWNILYFCEQKDNKIVKKKIKILKKTFPKITFTKANDKKEDWEQLLMMSCCEHQIIANSSFSWWGAYFNANRNKIVCYPSVWFGPKLADKDTSDLCPKSWVVIK